MAGSPVYYTRNLNIDESAGVITAPLSWAEQSAAFIIIIGLLWALSCLVSYKSDAFKCSCKQLYYLITPRSNVFSVIPCCWALWRSSSIALTIWTCARLLLLLHKARLLDVVTCTCTDTTLSATLIISRPLSTHYTLQVTLLKLLLNSPQLLFERNVFQFLAWTMQVQVIAHFILLIFHTHPLTSDWHCDLRFET